MWKCLWIVVFAVFATAQTTPAPRKPAPRKAAVAPPAKVDPAHVPLGTISVSGNRFYNANQVIGAAGVKIGEPMVQADFDAMKTRLEQTGAFEVVSYRYDPTPDGRAYALKIDVVEGLQLLPYRFEDLPATDAELRKILEQKQPLFANRLPPSRMILDQFAETLTTYLKAKNYKDAVTGKVASEAPGGLSIVFAPATPDPKVGQFEFSGHKILDTSTLANAFAPVIIGTSSKERDVRAMLDSGLRPMFEAKGLMRVRFDKIETEKMKDADGVNLKIHVIEGPQFKFGEIRVTGTGLTNKEAMGQVTFKPGELANMDLAQEATRKLRERLVHYGYMEGDVTYDKTINDNGLTVDVTLKLNCGRRYNMGELTIVGLDLNSEPAIRKMWGLPTGKPYSGNYPQIFLDEIKSEALFDNLKSMRYEDKVDKAKAVVSVTLYFVGGKDKPPPKRRGPFDQQ